MKSLVLILSTLVSLLSKPALAEGPIRAWLKNKIADKLEAEGPPIASKDIHSAIVKSGTYVFTFPFQGADRYYTLHVPPAYDPKKALPLVFVFHGGGGDMEIQSTEEYYHIISKSDSSSFLAVFPNGSSRFRSGKLATWNAGLCCGMARDSQSDDVAFVREILKHLENQTRVDRTKVFATGMSNGGMMSYRLACEAADIFTAIAAVAGTDNTKICKPTRPLSVLHIHARDDDHVLFNGGAGKSFRDPSQVSDFVSVPATVAKWKSILACESNPKRTLDKPGVFCETYSLCKEQKRLELCVTSEGGHSWPGGKKPRGNGAKPSTKYSATDAIWEFFLSRS